MQELNRNGVAVVKGFLPPDEVAALRDFLKDQPGSIIGEEFSKTTSTLGSMERGVKLQYGTDTILSSPNVHSLIEHPFFRDVASAYLSCIPIFSGLTAWWSLADQSATKSELNWSAQQYHFDYDWPAFLKFFIYLTDVKSDNGPFTYVLGTHERKQEWQEGRLEDSYVETINSGRVTPLIGSAGDLIIADNEC